MILGEGGVQERFLGTGIDKGEDRDGTTGNGQSDR